MYERINWQGIYCVEDHSLNGVFMLKIMLGSVSWHGWCKCLSALLGNIRSFVKN